MARIAVPVLVIGNTADDACTPSHTYRLFEAVRHERKTLREIRNANHYYVGQKQQQAESAAAIAEWLQQTGFAS